MKTDALIAKLASAKAAIAQAEADLGVAIDQIRVAPRAEKVAIGDVLEHAFEKLRVAKTELADVEVEIAGAP